MRVFVTGASGFIGRHVVAALLQRGHEVLAGIRNPARFPEMPGVTPIAVDFTRDLAAEAWLPRLAGVEAVVNCVGIIAEEGRNTFEALHTRAPIALFEACRRAGVQKVVQVSALGADEAAFSRYHLSKKAADDFLAGTDLGWTILQPSMVYGPGGTSTALMSALAALPVIPLVGEGQQAIQPVHVEDLAEAAVRILESGMPYRIRLPTVGPGPVTLRELLSVLRKSLGLGTAPMVPVPFRWVIGMAEMLEKIVATPLNGEALRMLQRGNTGDPGPLAALLGREPRALEDSLLGAPPSPAERLRARLFFLLPALRITLALLWIWSGLTSAFFYPEEESLELLAAVGVTGRAAPLVLYGASALDGLLGLAWLLRFRVVETGMLQILLMLVYSAIIAVFLPEFWLHPYAPLAKNLPLIVATLAVMAAE
jgi:uncharacterized protein YbjT (DUF2867 family)